MPSDLDAPEPSEVWIAAAGGDLGGDPSTETLVRRAGPPPGGPPAPPVLGPDPDPGQPPSRSRRRTALAGAIADALLADPDAWTPGELAARAAVTFAGRQDWLAGLIERVLEYYPRPPADRPRELAAVIDILLAEVFDGLRVKAERAAQAISGDRRADDGSDSSDGPDEDEDGDEDGVDDDKDDEDPPDEGEAEVEVEGDDQDEGDGKGKGKGKDRDEGEGEGKGKDRDEVEDEDDRPDEDDNEVPGRPTGDPDASPPTIPRPIRRLVTPTRMVRRPFDTPRLDDAADLADLLGLDIGQLTALADTALRGRRARSPRIANYRYRWLDRPSGPRLLEAPRSRLLAAQRTVLHSLLDPIPVHPAVHGFVAGRSVLTGAREHVGADTVLTMDLEHFFAAVTAGRIWGVLRAAGYPEPVAHLLAGLTTTATPVRVVGDMPPGPDPDRRHRLRQRLATPHLPQGSPTSPSLANLVAVGLDRRLSAYAAAAGLAYTRYADDLTFSGTFRHDAHVGAFAAAVARIATQEGFRINAAKTRRRGRHERQTVTGVVVNDHPAIARDEIDRLRAVLHDCRVNGPGAANRIGLSDFRAHLLGRISWVASVHPRRGARLRAQFDRIDWTGDGSSSTPDT